MNDLVGDEGCGGGLDVENVCGRVHRLEGSVVEEPDGGSLDGGEEGGGEHAGVEGMLGEGGEVEAVGTQIGGEGGGWVWMWEGLEGEGGLKGDGLAGEVGDAAKEAGVEGEAEFGERQELRGILWIVGGEHAGGGLGGVAEGGVAFENADGGTKVIKLKGKREADYSCTHDTNVSPLLHSIILVWSRTDCVAFPLSVGTVE